MAKSKKTHGQPEPAPALRIIVEPLEGAPVHYVDYLEVANTVHDFSLLCVRLPPKISDEKRKTAAATKELRVEPEVVITFPTPLVVGLIRALTIQKEAYEKMFGSKIEEPGGPK